MDATQPPGGDRMGRSIPRRTALSGGAAATLGITSAVLPRASAAASPAAVLDASFAQTSSVASDTGANGFSSYNLVDLAAAGSSVFVASFDSPGSIGELAAADLTVLGATELPFDLAGRLVSDGTYLYATPTAVTAPTEVQLSRITAGVLTATPTTINLSEFTRVGALVVAGSELLVAGETATGSRITKVSTATMTVVGSLDIAGADLVDAALDSPYLYAVSWNGSLIKVLLTGGPAGDGGMEVSAELDLGDDDAYGIALLDDHAYLCDAGYSDVAIRKVQLTGGSGAGGMEVVGRLVLTEEEDLRTATTDGSSLFFGGTAANADGSVGRVVKVRPTGGTTAGAAGMVVAGAVEPTRPGTEGFTLQQISDIVHVAGSIYVSGDDVIAKLNAGT